MVLDTVRKPVYNRLPILQTILVGLFMVLFFASLAFGASFWWKSQFDKTQNLSGPSNSLMREDTFQGVDPIKFNETGVASITPAEVDLYLETSNLAQFRNLVPGTPPL